MSKDIDKLFKDQLSNRSFEWKEAYWEEAEKAIVAAEKAKRKRRFFFFFWLTGGGVALASALLLGLWLTNQSFDLGSFPIDLLPGASAPVPPPMEPDHFAVNPVALDAANVEAVSEQLQISVAPIADEEQDGMEIYPAAKGFEPGLSEIPVLTSSAAVLAAIPALLFEAEHSLNPVLKTFIPEERLTEPVDRSFRWSAAATVGGRLDMQGQPGAWAGLALGGPLAGKLGWTAGLQYAIQQTTVQEIGSSEQTIMNFGAEKTKYALIARAVHHLELPIGLQYRLSPSLWLEGGVMPELRTGVRGALSQTVYPRPWERNPGEQADYQAKLAGYYADLAAGEEPEFPELERTETLQKGWLDAGREGDFQASAFAGAQVTLGGRFSLMGRLAYRLTQPAESQAKLNPLSLSLGAVYRLR
ncbi:MAG: hypothetical protein WA004_12915 [Saprospiraceae bacterium]